MDAGVDAGVGDGMDGDSDLEHPDRLRVRPAGKPVLDESPEWGRGPLKRLDQPSTLDLLARDVATAREAAGKPERGTGANCDSVAVCKEGESREAIRLNKTAVATART